MAAPNFLAVEKEVIYLYSTQWLASELLSLELFELLGSRDRQQVRFRNGPAQRLFFILLNDLLSPVDGRVLGEEKPYLKAIRGICEQPHFDIGGSKASLSKAVADFQEWLDTPISFDIYLSALDIETTLTMTRMEIVKITGNLLKHNLTRLVGAIKPMVEALKRARHQVTQHDVLRCVDVIEERFFDDILSLHGTQVTEFVNNLRWGIHEYLMPEYARSHRLLPNPRLAGDYTYDVPSSIQDPFSLRCYWDLMNGVRSRPFIPRFTTEPSLKTRY